MPTVKFTGNLKRFYPNLETQQLEVTSIPAILDELEAEFPKIKSYLVDDLGRLRKHVNIFIGDALVEDRVGLSDKVNPTDEIYIIQALSGG